MDEHKAQTRYEKLSWVKQVDLVYGKVDQFFRELGITTNEWRWARIKFPQFFKRIEELEESANPTALDKASFWDQIDRWGKNHLEIFNQIKAQRLRPEGFPEATEDDVKRAIREYWDEEQRRASRAERKSAG